MFPSYRGTEEVLSTSAGADSAAAGCGQADPRPSTATDEVGIEHLRAFYVDTREEVDAAYQACLDIGAEIHYPPEEDRDIEGYYEMFVFDPDGMRVEVACTPPGASISYVEQESL